MKKTIYKAFTWKIISTVLGFITAFLVTGNVKVSVTLAIVDFFVKMIAYIIHERFWE